MKLQWMAVCVIGVVEAGCDVQMKNRVDGSLEGHTFGEVQSAYFDVVDGAPNSWVVAWLSDYKMSCQQLESEQIDIALDYAEYFEDPPPPLHIGAQDPSQVTGHVFVNFAASNDAGEAEIPTETGAYHVYIGDQPVGLKVMAGHALFVNDDATVQVQDWFASGSAQVYTLDLEAQLEVSFSAHMSSSFESFSGGINATPCNFMAEN